MPFRFAIPLLGVLITAIAHAIEPCPAVVRLVFFDHATPPFVNGRGDTFPDPAGYMVTWNRKALQHTGCASQVQIKRRPLKRTYKELEHGEADVLGISAPTPERIRKFTFPQHKGQLDASRTFYVDTTSLWVRAGEKSIQWDGHQLKGPPGFKVGIPPGTVFETLARQKGWDMDLGVNGPNTLEKMLLGRVLVTLASTRW